MWLGTLFSMAATLFWLFSICCCSGRSNPHHKSNRKGGLWNNGDAALGTGPRGMKVEKTGAGYERVGDDQVPLTSYPAQQPLGENRGYYAQQQTGTTGAYEPFRHS